MDKRLCPAKSFLAKTPRCLAASALPNTRQLLSAYSCKVDSIGVKRSMLSSAEKHLPAAAATTLAPAELKAKIKEQLQVVPHRFGSVTPQGGQWRNNKHHVKVQFKKRKTRGHTGSGLTATPKAGVETHVAVGQGQWYHFGGSAPPILEPILVGIGMFTGNRAFDPWPCPVKNRGVQAPTSSSRRSDQGSFCIVARVMELLLKLLRGWGHFWTHMLLRGGTHV